MKSIKSIFKAVAIVTIFSIITRTLGFFFRIYISRKLGAEGMGLYQMASSVLGIFMTLIASGLPLTTAKMVTKYEVNNDLKKRNQVVTSSLVIALSVAVVSSLLVLCLKQIWGIILTDNRAVEILIIMIPSVIFSSVYAVFRGAIWGQSDYFNCGLTELIEQIIRFVLTFIMLNRVTDYFIATKYSAISFNITCLVSAVITILIYFKNAKLDFHKGEYKNILKSAVPITGVRLANSLVQPLTTLIMPSMLILSGYTQSEAIASFGVVMGMTFPMLFVPMAVIGSISMVLIPSISSMLIKNQQQEICNNITNTIQVSIFISMMFIPLYLSVGDMIGVILYNNTMSGIMLQISAFCVLPITLCNLTGSILNALNLEVKSFVNYLIGSAVLFAVLVGTTWLIGINSIILAFFLSMNVITLLNLSKIKKSLPQLEVNLIKTTFKYVLIVLPSSLLGHFVAGICYKFLPIFISCVVGGGISMLSVLILSSMFNLFDIKQLLNLLKSRKKART